MRISEFDSEAKLTELDNAIESARSASDYSSAVNLHHLTRNIFLMIKKECLYNQGRDSSYISAFSTRFIITADILQTISQPARFLPEWQRTQIDQMAEDIELRVRKLDILGDTTKTITTRFINIIALGEKQNRSHG
jgi:hypothetical protein